MAFSVSSAFCAQPSPDPIIIGYPSPALTELPNYLAVNKGFFTAEGLEAKFVRARSNILVAALVSGSVDYITSITSSIGGIVGGAQAKIVAGVTRNNPDFLMARPEIGSIRDLKGKKLAVSGFGGASHQRMLVILRGAGLDPQKDVNIISVGDAGLRMDQLRLGVIDATVLTAPALFCRRAGRLQEPGLVQGRRTSPCHRNSHSGAKDQRETGAGKESTPDSFEEPEISARES